MAGHHSEEAFSVGTSLAALQQKEDKLQDEVFFFHGARRWAASYMHPKYNPAVAVVPSSDDSIDYFYSAAAAAAVAPLNAAQPHDDAAITVPGSPQLVAGGHPCGLCAAALQLLTRRNFHEALQHEFYNVMLTDESIDAHSSVGLAPHNRAKNRYSDVVPFDANRVRLPQPLSDAPLSAAAADGYINASFVSDPSDWGHACGYVAAQAPLGSTLRDFWRMLLVTNASAVVMLSRLQDDGVGGSRGPRTQQPAYATYFPNGLRETLDIPGLVRVTCVHTASLTDGVTFRQLEAVFCQGLDGSGGGGGDGGGGLAGAAPEVRYLNHYHMQTWPDYGVPPCTGPLRRISRALDMCRRGGCRIVVHCSAGVGRSGAFIAIDLLLQRLDALRLHTSSGEASAAARVAAAFDVRGLVVGLRRQRRGMVQTSAQYALIYDAAIEELQALMLEATES